MKLTKEEKKKIIEIYRNGPTFQSVAYYPPGYIGGEHISLSNNIGSIHSRGPWTELSPDQMSDFITLKFNGDFVACLKGEYFDMVTQWEREKIREADEFVSKDLEKL